MQFLDKWERKFGWISFPGFLRYYAIFHVLVYLLQYVNPTIATFLAFDSAKILAGEVWRLVTFLFAESALIRQTAPQTLFLFIMVMVSFMMSNALEEAWGIFRTTIFIYVGWFSLIIGNFIYGAPSLGSGMLLFSSTFFAFATVFPKAELLVMFIIPVQARWLAILLALNYVYSLAQFPLIIGLYLTGFYVIGLANYFLWAGIPALRGQARVVKAVQRRKRFKKDSYMDEDTFHRCSTCDRTELSDPTLEFRIAIDGKEYCTDHLKD